MSESNKLEGILSSLGAKYCLGLTALWSLNGLVSGGWPVPNIFWGALYLSVLAHSLKGFVRL